MPKDIAMTEELTTRELEVLKLIAQGYTREQTAQMLGIGVGTVGTHRDRIGRKLKLHNTAQLARYAIKHGLLDAA